MESDHICSFHMVRSSFGHRTSVVIHARIVSECVHAPTCKEVVALGYCREELPLQKIANDIPLNTIQYHSVPFKGISIGLSGSVNGNLKYHSIPLNGIKNKKYHSHTIQLPMAIIPPRTNQFVEWYLNGIFCKGCSNVISSDLWCSRTP